MQISLTALVDALPENLDAQVYGDDRIIVTAPVAESTADVAPGGVFVARRGLSSDGHDYIPAAIERGAAAIVGQRAVKNLAVPYVQVNDPQMALGLLSAAYHGFPGRKLIVIGVTGTDGKTTTSTILHRILSRATGGKTGMINTLAADLGDASADTGLHVTTPGAPQTQAYLARMAANGLTHCVLEMTSHGLAQGRLNGVDIDVAVLTNLTHEHLDYHGTFEAYRAAKGIMFDMLAASAYKTDPAGRRIDKLSVINADDPHAAYFRDIAADRHILYGMDALADVRAIHIDYAPERTTAEVEIEGDRVFVATRLLGGFNVSNVLAALAVSHGLGFDRRATLASIEDVTAISGRMERIDEGQDFTAIVDFAHTPNALRAALVACRDMLAADSRLIAVFGSAGLRDIEKRRLMAETSAELADFTVLTAEDPRTEDLDNILQAMADGCLARGGVDGETFTRIRDRGAALDYARKLARPGDIVIACGKGHEQSMCFGVTEYPWDDRDAMRAALRGTPLRTLPTASLP